MRSNDEIQVLDHDLLTQLLVQIGIGQVTARVDQCRVTATHNEKLVGLHAMTATAHDTYLAQTITS